MHCYFQGVKTNNSYMTNSFDKKMNIRIEFMINISQKDISYRPL